MPKSSICAPLRPPYSAEYPHSCTRRRAVLRQWAVARGRGCGGEGGIRRAGGAPDFEASGARPVQGRSDYFEDSFALLFSTKNGPRKGPAAKLNFIFS